jgi:hypothetical protein
MDQLVGMEILVPLVRLDLPAQLDHKVIKDQLVKLDPPDLLEILDRLV